MLTVLIQNYEPRNFRLYPSAHMAFCLTQTGLLWKEGLLGSDDDEFTEQIVVSRAAIFTLLRYGSR